VQLLLGSDAGEQRLDQLVAAGQLKDYRLLHFATHGALDSATPARSALLLATDRLPDAEKQVREGKKVYTPADWRWASCWAESWTPTWSLCRRARRGWGVRPGARASWASCRRWCSATG
jgi:hypothetical protein